MINLKAGLFALSALCLTTWNAHVAMAQGGQKLNLLIVDKGDNSLVIYDPSAQKILGRVPVGEDPHEVAASSDGKYAFVSNYGGPGSNMHTIAVIDLVARKALPPIDIAPLHSAHGLAFADGKLYFTAETSKVIGRYDPAAGKIDWILGTGLNRTHMLIVTKDQKQIITSNIGSDMVSIIGQVNRPPPPPRPDGGFNGNRGGQGGRQPGNPPPPGGQRRPGGGGPRGGPDWEVTPIKAGQGPEGIALSPDEKEVWAGNSLDGTISVIDVATKKVVQSLSPNIERINRLKFTPDGKYVLVSSLASGDLTIFDAVARKEVKRVKIGRNAGGILVAPDGGVAYIACSMDNNVAILNLKTLEISSRIDSGSVPDGMTWAVENGGN